MAVTTRQIRLVRKPEGKLTEACFEHADVEVAEPAAGELAVEVRYLSIDAANRAWMQGATYRSALETGMVMAGGGLGTVTASRDPRFAVGDLVEADVGWQTHAVVPASTATKVTPMGPLSHHLSVLGITGLTAYYGLFDVARPVPGETVVVSAAAGAVGNVVVQLSKLAGCRVVGVAGGAEKCRWLVDELGADASVDYREGDLRRQLRAAAPDGVDVFFDNTGGDVLGVTLFAMNQGGRIACCGVVSQYDTATPAPGPRGVPGLLVTKRLRMEGFIVMDFFATRATATARLAGWLGDGRLVAHQDVWEGVESAPGALIDLLGGGNRGKRMVRVAGEG